MNINPRYQTIILVVLSAGLVFWLGRLSLQYELSLHMPDIHQIGEINEKIPMVDITDIKDGKLLGTVNQPDIRLKSGSEVAVPDQDKHFELNISNLGFAAKPDPRLKVPADAKFVASKTGKYFYALDEATAKRLNPLTRVFFTTEEEAVEAGYQKRTK